jgi:hypothetical protein
LRAGELFHHDASRVKTDSSDMPNATATPPLPAKRTKVNLSDWIEVFRAGTHTDCSGKQMTFAASDLDEMVANVALGKPPAVLGHPKHDDPAYAWATLKREGDSLFAKFEDINPAFAAGVDAGAYRNRSVYVFQDKGRGWRVRHIGWLGAKPPAIDGLKPVAFAADDVGGFEFAAGDPETQAGYELAWGLQSAAQLLRGFREYLIEQSGIEAADRVVPTWQLDSMQASADRARAALSQPDTDDSTSTAYTHPEGGVMPFTQEDIDKARQEAQAETEAKFAAQGQELAELRATRITERVSTQVNDLVSKGIVTPAEKAGAAAFMTTLETDFVQAFAFAAPDGKAEIKQTPAEWFAAFMAGRKPIVKLGRDERLDEDTQPALSNDPSVIANKAAAYMAEQEKLGITVSLADAVTKFSTPVA